MSVTRRSAPQPAFRPAPLSGAALRDPRLQRGRGRAPFPVVVAAPIVIAVLLLLAAFAPVSWSVEGLAEGQSVQPASLAVDGVDVAIGGLLAGRARVSLDGQVEQTEPLGDGVRWRPAALPEGEHELWLTAPRRFLPDRERVIRFVVDATAPALVVNEQAGPLGMNDPVVISGTAEPGVAVTAADTSTVAGDDGAFTLELPAGVPSPVAVLATDAAGNVTAADVVVDVEYPVTRGIHVSFGAWTSAEFRETLYRLLAERHIDTVQLDLKNETGAVGFNTTNALAREIGAVRPGFDLAAAVADLKARGARVVGRIVAFRDPILTEAMWARGERDWALQTPDGEMLTDYGGFSNYTNAGVRAYNLDLAEEAARAGVEDILWDYIRRPAGEPASMVIPGRGDVPSTEWIASFLAEGRARLRPLGVYQGASVFGIAATRPDAIAQNIPLMAQHLDYVAPMLYPSHWNPGEYGVADPNSQPYDIVKASLAGFQRVLEPSGTPLVPWLQDFDDGVVYDVAEVQAQIRAAADLGIDSWLLWNSRSRYTWDALEPLDP